MRHRGNRRARVTVVTLLVVTAGGGWLAAQAAPDVDDLRAALAPRYDIVPLQRGVALVPQDPDAGIGVIQVVDGTVSIDGDPLTGGELSARLGADAALVVQVSYLSAEAQLELAGAPAAPVVVVPLPPPPPPSPPAIRRRVRAGDRVRVGGGVTVERDERVSGDAVSIFGSSNIDGEVGGDAVTIFGVANIDGEVFGDAVAIMGAMRLGPNAIIHGETTVVGGPLIRAPGAELLGAVNEIGGFSFGGLDGIDLPDGVGRGFGPRALFRPFWSRAGNFAATAVRAILLILIGLITVAVARSSVEHIAAQGREDVVRSGLIGLLAEVLFVPVVVVTLIVLAVSVVGIPLIALVPFGILFVVVLMLVGFSGVAYGIGRQVLDRLGWSARSAYLAVTLGVLAILTVTLLARLAAMGAGFLGLPLTAIGYLVEYVAWTVGFGAVILALVEWRWRRGSQAASPEPPPPPLPGEA